MLLFNVFVQCRNSRKRYLSEFAIRPFCVHHLTHTLLLFRYSGSLNVSGNSQPSNNLTVAMRDLSKAMDESDVIAPVILVQVLHMIFPRFAEKSEHGGFVQQDANECWTELMRMLQQKLRPQQLMGDSLSTSAKSYDSFIDQYFGGSFKCTMKNVESEAELESTSVEDFLQLSCFISQDIKYMQSGLKTRLLENITKRSSLLERDCVYTKSSKISRLPAYLTVQFVRFFYKENQSVNAKILKDIKFTTSLDVFELCTDELQEKLIPMRNKFKEMDDKNANTKEKSTKSGETQGSAEVAKIRHPFSFEDDVGSNNSGFYDLQAVLTHKGRSSSSGHYVAWIKKKENEWFKCDDDTVTFVPTEEILKLSGGGKLCNIITNWLYMNLTQFLFYSFFSGDWHCAYLLLYGPRILETEKSPAAAE